MQDTLVVVHAYAGDAHQVEAFMPQYLHHGFPVLVLSPADSPVVMDGAWYEAAGKRAYTGQDSIDRQRAHLEILLGYPASFYLLHDSDSMCLAPRLPAYLYENPGTVHYNASPTSPFVTGELPAGPERNAVLARFPVAFQPPLFFSRDSLEAMLAVSDAAMAALPPFAKLIDWYFEAMAQEARLPTRAFPDGISRPIWHLYEIARVYAMVRLHGFVFLHSVKSRDVLDVLVSAHAEWNRDPGGRELCGSW